MALYRFPHLTDEEKQQILFGDLTVSDAMRGVAYMQKVPGRHEVNKQLDPEARWLSEIITCWEGEESDAKRKMRWKVIFTFENGGRHDDWDRLSSSSRTEKDHGSGQTSWNTIRSTNHLKLSSVEFTLHVREAEAASDLRWAIEKAASDRAARAAESPF